jgi:hypothetical protein
VDQSIRTTADALGSGASVRLQVGARLSVIFTLHVASQPISAPALQHAGCGSATQIQNTLNHLVSTNVLEHAGTRRRSGFTATFTEQIHALHNGIGIANTALPNRTL